jgi:pantetheine-phosphate adenylyltransferase
VTTVLYPGSFDPIHNGHRELIETASYLFDRVVVAAIRNLQKSDGLFTLTERQAMIRDSLDHLDNVDVVAMAKLTVDVAKENGCDFIIKGLRAVSDFDTEMAQAQMNLTISGVHTLFLPSGSTSSFIQSKFVRDVAKFGGDLTKLVPLAVQERLEGKFPTLPA